MPEMDGFKLAECIRATEKYYELGYNKKVKSEKPLKREPCQIIAVTGCYEQQNDAKAKKSGMGGVYHKPIGVDEINEILRRFFFKGSGRRLL